MTNIRYEFFSNSYSYYQFKVRFAFYFDFQCFLCDTQLVIDLCHINHNPFDFDPFNLVILCPNCHRLFDSGLIRFSLMERIALIAIQSKILENTDLVYGANYLCSISK